MDKETLHLMMNFHLLEAKSIDLSSAITRMLNEEKIPSAPSNTVKNLPKLGERKAVLAENKPTALRSRDDKRPGRFRLPSTSTSSHDPCSPLPELRTLSVNTTSAIHNPTSNHPKKVNAPFQLKQHSVYENEVKAEHPQASTLLITDTRSQKQVVFQDCDDEPRKQKAEKRNPIKNSTIPAQASEEIPDRTKGVIEIGHIAHTQDQKQFVSQDCDTDGCKQKAEERNPFINNTLSTETSEETPVRSTGVIEIGHIAHTQDQKQFVSQDCDTDGCKQKAEERNPFINNTLSTETSEETPVRSTGVIEIGHIGAEECEYIARLLVKANEVFEELPDEMSDEKKLREEQRAFLSNHKHMDGEVSRERKLEIKQAMLAYFEEKVVEIVKFAKRIPGFKDLTMDDQIALVRESSAESALIGGMRLINTENKVFSAKGGQHFTIEEMMSVIPGDAIEEKAKTSKKITLLSMCPEEESLLRAISITATDRRELDDPNACQNIHNKLVTSLIHVITKMGKFKTGVRFGQLVDVLVNLRSVTEKDMALVKNMLLEEPDYANRPVVQDFL